VSEHSGRTGETTSTSGREGLIAAEATVGHFRVYRDPDPDPDGGPISWVVEDMRDGAAMSDWFTYGDAITDAMERDRADRLRLSRLQDATRNQALGWCPCGQEADHDCECGVARLSAVQGLSEVVTRAEEWRP
jgi:hypothetical protein